MGSRGVGGAWRRTFQAFGVIAVCLVGWVAAARSEAEDASIKPPYTKKTLIAHRGASGLAPEHTIAAYKLALEHGADFVEPDLQITKDGVLVCLHDMTLERTTDVAERFPDRAVAVGQKRTWPVADFTLAEIKTLDAGRWKGEAFAGERVPTFQEMIDVVRGRAGIIPETKSPEAYEKRGLAMEPLVMAVLKSNGLDQPGADPATPVVIQSFSERSLTRLRNDLGCRLPLVYVFSDAKEAKPNRLDAIARFADGIGPSKAVLGRQPDLVREAHDRGLSVTAWTFRRGQSAPFATVTEEIEDVLVRQNVDAVFTDNPELFPSSLKTQGVKQADDASR